MFLKVDCFLFIIYGSPLTSQPTSQPVDDFANGFVKFMRSIDVYTLDVVFITKDHLLGMFPQFKQNLKPSILYISAVGLSMLNIHTFFGWFFVIVVAIQINKQHYKLLWVDFDAR